MGQILTVTHIMWVQKLLKKLKIKETVLKEEMVIYTNNQGVIKLAENSIFQKQNKYIAIQYYYIQNLIKQGDISLKY